jgi:hypothetical protein
MYSKLDAPVEEEIIGDSLAIQYVLNQVRNTAKQCTRIHNGVGRRAAGSRRPLL